jgi:hypothetical protein
MAIWKKVLTSVDITTAVTNGNTTQVPTSDAVADALAGVSAAAGSGDITSVLPGLGITVLSDNDGPTTAVGSLTDEGGATKYQSVIKVKPKTSGGITVDSDGVSIATTVAGDALTLASGVLSVATGPGLQIVTDTVKARVDGVTIATDPSSDALTVKDGGISFAKLSGGAIVTSDEAFSNNNTQIATTKAIGATFPNVEITGENYVTLGGATGQMLTFGEISIADNTNLGTATATSAQDSLQLTLTGSTLSATAPNLGVGDDVQFVDLSLTGTLDVDGNVVLGNSTTNTVTIAGNLIVQGETTTLDVANLKVEDKIIALATASTTPALGTNAGIQITTGTDELEFPELKWVGNSALTGWQVQNYVNGRSDDNDLVSIAVMDVKSNATPTNASLSAGVGAFWFDETSDALYIRTA